MDLVLATKNLDKIKEIKDALRELKLRILTLKDFPNFPDVEEDEDSFYDNALKKARAIAKFSGKLSLADDSGLEVEGYAISIGLGAPDQSVLGAYETEERALAVLDFIQRKMESSPGGIVVLEMPKE